MLRIVASAALAVAGVPVAIAQADVSWEAPAGCPSQEEFQELVGDIGAASTAIVVASQRADGAWLATVAVGGARRQLVGATCAEVAAAAALIVALALRDDGGVDLPLPTVTTVPLPAATVPPEITGIERRAVGSSAAGLAPWSLEASLGAQVGALPGVASHARAALGIGWSWLLIQLDASLSAVALGPMEGPAMASADVRLLSGGAVACRRGARLSLCAGVEAGAMTMEAENASSRAVGGGTWVASRAGPVLALPLGRGWALVGRAEIGAPLIYPRFSINGVPAHDPGGPWLRSSVGLRHQFR